MRKVAVFIDSLTSGGAERAVIILSHYFSEKSNEIVVITMHDECHDFYTLGKGVKRYSLNLAKKNRGLGKLFCNIDRVRTIREIIKKEKCDVLIGMMTMCSVLSTVSCFGLSTFSITAERNYPGKKTATKPWGFLRSVFYRFADAHIVQSKETAAWLEKHTGVKNTYVIPNAVTWPLQSFTPSITPESLVSTDSKLILAVGTKPYQKGFDILLEAFSAMGDRSSSWVLAIVGLEVDSDNVELSSLCKLINHLGIASRVIFPGRIGNVADWYQRADIFVLSSRYEGFPNVLLEAMASGCPSIAFDCDTGPRDIIRHGENGLLIEPEDVEKLTEAMLILMHDDALRQRIATSSIKVREKFSPETIFNEWVKVINSF